MDQSRTSEARGPDRHRAGQAGSGIILQLWLGCGLRGGATTDTDIR
jgi:hypothetical protein